MAPTELLARLRSAQLELPDKPDETAESTLQALAAVAGADFGRLQELVALRLSGVPLSHLTARQKFLGMEMIAGPEALIPRKETEILARGALEKLCGLVRERGPASVIDACCGSGNVGLALAWHQPGCTVTGWDLSAEAVKLAQRNARHLGLEDRCSFGEADLFAGCDRAADLVTCNPPYISTAKVENMPREISAFEPKLAFDGGPFGVRILTRLIREAPLYLKPASWLAFEVGLGQGKAMVKMVGSSVEFSTVETLSDASGEIRAVLALRV